MTLAALIRKSESGKVATAIPAISATQPREAAATVARIATVAVANPTETETATASRWWLLHYPDREPVEVASFPPAIHAEMLERHPGAIAAEPIHQAEMMAALTRPIPDDLERLIQRAAAYWQYSPDDLAVIQQAAQRHPEGLRLALENDVAFCR